MYSGKRQPTGCTQNAHSCRQTALSRTEPLLREAGPGRGAGRPQDSRGGDAAGGTRGGGRWSGAFPGGTGLQLPESAGGSRAAAGAPAIPAAGMCAVCAGDALETNPGSSLTFSLPPSSQFWACVPKSLSSLLGLSP